MSPRVEECARRVVASIEEARRLARAAGDLKSEEIGADAHFVARWVLSAGHTAELAELRGQVAEFAILREQLQIARARLSSIAGLVIGAERQIEALEEREPTPFEPEAPSDAEHESACVLCAGKGATVLVTGRPIACMACGVEGSPAEPPPQASVRTAQDFPASREPLRDDELARADLVGWAGHIVPIDTADGRVRILVDPATPEQRVIPGAGPEAPPPWTGGAAGRRRAREPETLAISWEPDDAYLAGLVTALEPIERVRERLAEFRAENVGAMAARWKPRFTTWLDKRRGAPARSSSPES